MSTVKVEMRGEYEIGLKEENFFRTKKKPKYVRMVAGFATFFLLRHSLLWKTSTVRLIDVERSNEPTSFLSSLRRDVFPLPTLS